MGKLLPIVIIVVIGMAAYKKIQQKSELGQAEAEAELQASRPESRQATGLVEYEDDESHVSEPRYRCDGRQHCSQMSSCKEATWFINHCPDTKMDGDNDGVPCETQWCSHLR